MTQADFYVHLLLASELHWRAFPVKGDPCLVSRLLVLLVGADLLSVTLR